jgi:hypothetical protein
VGTGYFDTVTQVIAGGTSSTLALEGSTEQAQFSAEWHEAKKLDEGPDAACQPILGECPAEELVIPKPASARGKRLA